LCNTARVAKIVEKEEQGKGLGLKKWNSVLGLNISVEMALQ
jgi:hypothetical protein